ncbi:metallophosphoesterase [Halosimplex salinum]|uniref:metallophosphoesterase n=1 Tax=Halosimplex salinum TaxID=1710538 RepID=UPI000F47A4F9|nr:metallophosphoesterase [Halosimplex salinum]
MQLGIVSDTHDDLDAVERAVAVFEREGCDAVVHCGDFVAPFSATPFDASFDFHAVRGNNDGEWALGSTVDDFGTYHGELGELTLDGREFAVYHGTAAPIVDALVDCGRYDYVLHGHTHEFAHEERENTVRINPGGIPFEGAPGAHYAVVLETETGAFERYELP